MAVTWKISNTDYTVKGAKGTNQITMSKTPKTGTGQPWA